jgi:hypothetical protein
VGATIRNVAGGDAGGKSWYRRYRDSPRAQRRAFSIAIAIFVVGAAAFVFAFFRNTSHPLPDVASKQNADVYVKQKDVPPDPAVYKIARQFIATAVARQNIDTSYDIVGSDIRGTMTRQKWATGNIPVVPYPVDTNKVLFERVDYSHPKEVLLEVGLFPRTGVDVMRLTFFIGFVKVGTGTNAHWVVNYWNPHYRPPVPLTQ